MRLLIANTIIKNKTAPPKKEIGTNKFTEFCFIKEERLITLKSLMKMFQILFNPHGSHHHAKKLLFYNVFSIFELQLKIA